jgi:hypothetical protein
VLLSSSSTFKKGTARLLAEKPEEMYAAVLLPQALGGRHVRRMGAADDPNGQRAWYAHDASSLPFMVEELIGQGVTFLAIDANSPYFGAVKDVPDTYRRRLLRIDKDNKCSSQIQAVMGPIMDETGVELDGPFSVSLRGKNKEVEDAVALLLLRDLRPYLLALEHALQVDVDLDAIRANLSVLDRHLSSSDARAHLAMLNLIFGAYEKRPVSDFALAPASPAQRAEAFQHFVEDAECKELSRQRKLFGFPALLEGALLKFDRLMENIVSSSPLRHLFTLGTKTIETATTVPQADAKLLESLIPEGYLPPIISLDGVRERAKAAWRRAKPPFIPTFRHKHDEGVDLVADDEQPPID